VRIALIAIGDAGAGEGGKALLAGRTIARQQTDFALALGCEKIVLFGDGTSAEAIGLRHAAEKARAQVQVIPGVRYLPATVRGDDQLLVLAQGLLPDSREAFERLREGQCLLVLPAEAGWSAGFERLDLAAAWGGAMVIPGRLVAGLDELPEDAEPVAGLLRIARQAGVPEQPLPERELAEGRWQIVRTAEAALAMEAGWIDRRLPAVSPFRPTSWLSRWLVRRFGRNSIGKTGLALGLAAGAAFGLAIALIAAWFGFAAGSFAVLVPAAMAIEAGEAVKKLSRSIFDERPDAYRTLLVFRLIWDAVLLAAGVLAIDGSRVHRLFPPMVLLGLLHASPPVARSGWRALAGDRGLFAVLLSLSAVFGLTEGAFMALSLVLLALRLASPVAESRLTRV
jgi:hypothetical protein